MSAPIRLSANGDWSWDSRALAVTLCNIPYKVVVYKGGCGGPCAKLVRAFSTGSGTSGVEYELIKVQCGCGYVVFGSGDREICQGTPACGPACANTFQLKVSAGQCGFTVPGWYPIADCGGVLNCRAEELEVGDALDLGIVIVGGPFDTQAEAAAICGPLVCVPPDPELPTRTYSRGPKKVMFGGSIATMGTQILRFDVSVGYWRQTWAPGAGPPVGAGAGFGWCGNAKSIELKLAKANSYGNSYGTDYGCEPFLLITTYYPLGGVREIGVEIAPSSYSPFVFDWPGAGPGRPWSGSSTYCQATIDQGISLSIAEG